MKMDKIFLNLSKRSAFLVLSGHSYTRYLCLPAVADVHYFQKFISLQSVMKVVA